jgi:nitroimidazol reductase NimA-like FMN-containing flavoprotein (pyridoxamine 5'-phosphate oxidase superfamily)
MRRTDRQVNTKEELLDILKAGKVIQIAFIDNDEPYMVTMNYGFIWNSDDKIRLYFHSANEGRKIEIIKKNPRVCFSISICDPFVAGERACNYGMKYRSVVGYGKIRIVKDNEERLSGLNLLMEQYTGKSDWSYEEEMLKKTTVSCLEVEQISGKRKK